MSIKFILHFAFYFLCYKIKMSGITKSSTFSFACLDLEKHARQKVEDFVIPPGDNAKHKTNLIDMEKCVFEACVSIFYIVH